jgi:hypothetical protein
VTKQSRAPAPRQFSSGANRDTAEGKHDFDGFFSPLMFEAFGTYMDYNRQLPDGSIRDSDNWQLGIPLDVYRKSLWRHWFDVWRFLRGYKIKENIIWACMGCIFNLQGIVHELLKEKPELLDECRAQMERERVKRLAGNRGARR